MDDIELAEQNCFAAWRLLASHAEGGLVEETDGVLYTSIPAPVAFFNSAYIKPPARVADHIDAVISYFGAKNVPFTVRFRDNEQDAADCATAGLTLGGTGPYMTGDAKAMAAAPEVDVRVVDARTMADYISVMAAAYGMPQKLCESVFGPSSLTAENYALFLAYDGATPVASSALVVTDDVAGIYNVGTPPEYRNRGFGEAATRAAVVEGVRRGCTRTTLQASAMGLPIYERMGFRTVTTWRNYTGRAP